MPAVGTVDDEIHIRHSAEDAHEAEIIVCSHEVGFTNQAVFALLRHCFVRRKVGNQFDGKVAARDSLVLCAVEIAQQSVVGVCLEVFDVVDVGHVGCALSAFESVVGSDVADKPFREISAVVFPCKRSVCRIDSLDSCFSGGYEVFKTGFPGSFLFQPVVA